MLADLLYVEYLCKSSRTERIAFTGYNSLHEILNLRIFNSCVKKRKYKVSSLRTSSAFSKDA